MSQFPALLLVTVKGLPFQSGWEDLMSCMWKAGWNLVNREGPSLVFGFPEYTRVILSQQGAAPQTIFSQGPLTPAQAHTLNTPGLRHV